MAQTLSIAAAEAARVANSRAEPPYMLWNLPMIYATQSKYQRRKPKPIGPGRWVGQLSREKRSSGRPFWLRPNTLFTGSQSWIARNSSPATGATPKQPCPFVTRRAQPRIVLQLWQLRASITTDRSSWWVLAVPAGPAMPPLHRRCRPTVSSSPGRRRSCVPLCMGSHLICASCSRLQSAARCPRCCSRRWQSPCSAPGLSPGGEAVAAAAQGDIGRACLMAQLPTKERKGTHSRLTESSVVPQRP